MRLRRFSFRLGSRYQLVPRLAFFFFFSPLVSFSCHLSLSPSVSLPPARGTISRVHRLSPRAFFHFRLVHFRLGHRLLPVLFRAPRGAPRGALPWNQVGGSGRFRFAQIPQGCLRLFISLSLTLSPLSFSSKCGENREMGPRLIFSALP